MGWQECHNRGKGLGKTHTGSIFTVNTIERSLFQTVRSATINGNSRGLLMRSFSLLVAATAFLILAGSTNTPAADLSASSKILAGAQLVLSCDNGRSYPIRPRAVSDQGELVTGYIQTAPRKLLHFRLFPMGTGYRYGGHGFWFDGVRGAATLFVDDRQAACTVERA